MGIQLADVPANLAAPDASDPQMLPQKVLITVSDQGIGIGE